MDFDQRAVDRIAGASACGGRRGRGSAELAPVEEAPAEEEAAPAEERLLPAEEEAAPAEEEAAPAEEEAATEEPAEEEAAAEEPAEEEAAPAEVSPTRRVVSGRPSTAISKGPRLS